MGWALCRWTLLSPQVSSMSWSDKGSSNILNKWRDLHWKNLECPSRGGKALEQKENFQVLTRDEGLKCIEVWDFFSLSPVLK